MPEYLAQAIENLTVTQVVIFVVTFLVTAFVVPFLKRVIDLEHDRIVRLLNGGMFGLVAVWLRITGATPTVADARDDVHDHYNAAVGYRGDGDRPASLIEGIRTAVAKTSEGLSSLLTTAVLASTRAYAICGCGFLFVYRADSAQRWKLLRFVASQRRRVRRRGL